MMRFINYINRFINEIYNRWILTRNRVVLKGNLLINGRLYIHNQGELIIGDKVRINSGHRFNPVGGQTLTRLIVLPGATLRIGNGVGISNSTIVAQTSVQIDDGVMIGGSCNIWDTDFHSLNPEIRGTNNDIAKTKPVSIGRNAFIGGHSIVLKGVSVGCAAIIGAGSVVRRSIPDSVVYAGDSRPLGAEARV